MKNFSLWLLIGLCYASLLAGCGNNDSQSAAKPQATTQSKAGSPATSGKVLKAIHAGGYTYMQVENDGKQFWIAGNMIKVKRDEQVSWSDPAVMKNFKSSSLHRTFDEILFVSSVQVK